LPPDSPHAEQSTRKRTINKDASNINASSLFAQLTPMLSERAVIMVVSKIDDQHLLVSVIPERTIKCSKPGCRSGGSAFARSARRTHPVGAGHRGPRHPSHVGLDFAGRSSALVR
jgi:hypothetical protein